MCIGKHLAAVLPVLFLAGCTGDAMAPGAPPDPPNRPPVVTGAIPDQRLAGPGATTALDVAAHFSDPDGDALAYGAATSDTSVVSVSATGSAVTLTGGGAGGTARVTVTARDLDGAEALATFGVTVNRLPVASEQIPAQTLVAETPPLEVDMSGYFGDPDGDALAFDAASSDTSVVTVTVAGAVTVLSAQAIGEAEVTVTARDPDGAEAQATFGVVVVENPDRAALVGIYGATDGPNWFSRDNWLSDTPLGDWYGISTDDAGRVVGLNLSNNGLNGEIPKELWGLTKLQALDLSESPDLGGEIPSEVGNLTHLTHLSIWFNRLTGEIPPELGNLTRLKTLILTGATLTGPIPPELGNLANLDSLVLGGHLKGVIPPELGELTNLTRLSLWGDLTGEIPPDLGRLANLEILSLGGNDFVGPIPPELGDLANLTDLRLVHNVLTGGIPTELGNLSQLKRLLLLDNGLTGSIPPELGNLSQLQSLHLGKVGAQPKPTDGPDSHGPWQPSPANGALFLQQCRSLRAGHVHVRRLAREDLQHRTVLQRGRRGCARSALPARRWHELDELHGVAGDSCAGRMVRGERRLAGPGGDTRSNGQRPGRSAATRPWEPIRDDPVTDRRQRPDRLVAT